MAVSQEPTLVATLSDLFPQSNLAVRGTLDIQYPTFTVASGAIYPRDATQPEPTVVYSDSEPGAKYTLIMSDPDLFKHNDGLSGQVRHWVQPGLTFADPGSRGKITEPATTVYLGPSPGLGTGNHRYLFVLAKQLGTPADAQQAAKFTVGGPQADLKDRMGFDVAQYVHAAGLEVVSATVMEVGGTVGSTLNDVRLMGESATNAVLGK
ncbi:PEBP-like protein [Auriscalpium vulgare]|uniref:PEBP-like protein n=1 Tax=Auriscalpium vulgare TaxID=40419 RepID=A0ACB8S828_9AGAM|nr:PEBP-like protein [Auriscalpium vulgare]